MKTFTVKEFSQTHYPLMIKILKGTAILPKTVLVYTIIKSQGKMPDGSYRVGGDYLAKKGNNFCYTGVTKNWIGKNIDYNRHKFKVYDNYVESILDFTLGLISFAKNKGIEKELKSTKSAKRQLEILKISGYKGVNKHLIDNIENNLKLIDRYLSTSDLETINKIKNSKEFLFARLKLKEAIKSLPLKYKKITKENQTNTDDNVIENMETGNDILDDVSDSFDDSTTKKGLKKYTPYIIGFVLLSSIIGGAIYLYKKKKK